MSDFCKYFDWYTCTNAVVKTKFKHKNSDRKHQTFASYLDWYTCTNAVFNFGFNFKMEIVSIRLLQVILTGIFVLMLLFKKN